MEMDVLSNCDCDFSTNYSIEMLKYFSSRPYNEKPKIIEIGRPTPKLKLTQVQKKITRYFNAKFYKNFEWLCGCVHENKMYCWPCLIFGKEKNIWNTNGYSDLNNFSNASKKHYQSTAT